MRVIVCGSRFANCPENVWGWLDRWLAKCGNRPHDITLLVSDEVGVDAMACEWAVARHVNVETFATEWKRYGKEARRERNKVMVTVGKPNYTIAFTGGSCATDMILGSKARGLPVRLAKVILYDEDRKVLKKHIAK